MNPGIKKLLALLGTIAVGIFLWTSKPAAAVPQERLLIIHTDDAGLCDGVNEGTKTALEQGVVSSTSIMVVCPGFEDFARYAVANPKYDYGVHLVLTCESSRFRWGPVLKGQVPSLVQPDGTFWRSSEEVAQHAKPEEVRDELRSQIQRALDRRIPISHLDHHMWVLLQRPDLLRIFVDLGLEYQLPIRLHRTHTPAECGAALKSATEYDELIQPAVAKGNPLFDFIETDNYDVVPDRKRSYYLSQLRKLKPGISEFVIHCCADFRPGLTFPGAQDRRAADTRVFTSVEIQDEIRRLGIRVVNWKQLTKLQRAAQAP